MVFTKIRDLREDRDMTQAQAAEKLFIHVTQYRRYETGERAIPLETAVRIAQLFGVSLDYLAGVTSYDSLAVQGELSDNEKELLTLYRRMNGENRGRLLERADFLVSSQK